MMLKLIQDLRLFLSKAFHSVRGISTALLLITKRK